MTGELVHEIGVSAHEIGLAVRTVLVLIPVVNRWFYPDKKFQSDVRVLPRYDEPTILPLRLTRYYNVPRAELNLMLQNLSAYRVVLERLVLSVDAVSGTWAGTERRYPRRPEPYNLDPFTRNLTAEEYARLWSLRDQTVIVEGAVFMRGGRRQLRAPVRFTAKITTTPTS